MQLGLQSLASTFAAGIRWDDGWPRADMNPIAEKLFNELRCDRLLLEYDSARAGDFVPLRHVPKEKIVVLGLITTKHGDLESQDEIMRQIDKAAQYIPMEQLALSPQCGFASSGRGNPLTEEQQRRKLELVAVVARKAWNAA